MLSEQQLSELPSGITNQLEKLNSEVLKLIGTRIKEIGTLTPSDAHRLQQLETYGTDVNKITRELAKMSSHNVDEIYAIYDTVAADNVEFSESCFVARGMKSVPYSENTQLQDFVKAMGKQTAETYINMSQTTGFMYYNTKGEKVFSYLSKTYHDVIDRAVTAVSLGTEDYQTAMRKTIRDLADSGLRTKYKPLQGSAGKTVDYATGYSRRLDTAVRQNILWGVKQCNQSISDMLGSEFGADGYEISYHINPRPSHAAMGGGQYAIGESKTVDGEYYPSFSEVEDLLMDYNCLHFKFPIILGVSIPNFSKAELERLKAQDRETFEFEGKTYTGYEAKQVQRKLETAMRHAKDRQIIAAAAGDDVLRRQEQQKINILAEKYSKFSDAAKLPTKKERASVSGYHRVKTQKELKKPFTSIAKDSKIYVKPTDKTPPLRITQVPASTVSAKISTSEYSTILSKQQYLKHCDGTPQYKQYLNDRLIKGGNPQSVLTISQSEAQNIINQKSGTGIVRVTRDGTPKPMESVTCDTAIGYYYGGGKYHPTNKATIHYGKKSAHIVPIKGDDYD